ncbi:hypothetical protein KRP22_004995 [Phytophthora ramorum]|nr:hypothetical protein KRP22_12579 [Phytophthora ramorum]
MPATQVSPAMRRRISDDARQLLRVVLSECCEDLSDAGVSVRSVNHLPVTERMQNFRAQLWVELLGIGGVGSGTAVPLRITTTSSTYLLRYQVARTGAEVSVLNRAGVMTSWVTTADGYHIQLGRFLSSMSDDRHETTMQEASKAEIFALLGVLDSLDLLDMVRALGPAASGIFVGGYPLSITQAATAAALEDGSSGARAALQLSIGEYVRHDGSGIAAPIGIKSDVELLVETAVSCFYEWTSAGRQQLEQIFALLDQDSDGSVSGQDVVDQLLGVGHSSERANSIATEMTRLMCDSDDPSEEVTFLPFVGFWIMLFADDVGVSDSDNESRVLPALQQLFLDAA